MPLLFLLIPLLILAPGSIIAATWRPVDASELGQKTPRVDPAADAEAIFWDIRIEDRLQGQDLSQQLHHYIRVKIFTQRGKEQYATVEIPRSGKRTISQVAGRTIKPDGTIIDVKKDGIFDRELAKTKGLKLRGTTFSLPNVEVGDIIEYRYTETRQNEAAEYMRLYMQRELPMWSVTYHFKPLQIPYLPYGVRSIAFNCTLPPFQKEPDGFYAVGLTNVPAFQEEPYMPPEDQLRSWILLYYEEDKKLDPEKFWKEIGKGDFARFKPRISPDGAIKRTVAEMISGIAKPEDQLAALDLYCRTKITNLSDGASRMTPAERKAIKENRSAGDTLKQQAGWGIEIDELFAAMANAAGFDARMVRIPSRGDTFFTKQMPTAYFIRSFSVGVKVNDQWRFFDPSTPYLQAGMLRWQEEGVPALVSDPKAGFFVPTLFSPPTRSMRQRRAKLKLDADGAIEGTVEYTYTGHTGMGQKYEFAEMTASQQEERWKKSLQNRLSTAELSEFEMRNAADARKPLTVTHKVTVPGYATRTGKRILLQPAFFERNLGPRFTESQRKWDIYFDYGWVDDDEVTIDLPDGWELDQPVRPTSVSFGAGEYSVKVLKTTDGRKLIYQRKLEMGRDMKILLPASAYKEVKRVFDMIQEQDAYTIALKAAGDAGNDTK